MFALSSTGVGERRLGRSESPSSSLAATIAAGERGFQPDATRINAILTGATKSVSLRRKKRYTTEGARDGTRLVATRYFPYGLIFHFGWERRRVGPFMRGLGSAANE